MVSTAGRSLGVIHDRAAKTCALTYAVQGGALLTVSAPTEQQPELKPERAEAKVYDPDAQTGPRCRASHQSLTAPPLHPAWPAPASPDETLINMPIKVLFVLHHQHHTAETKELTRAYVTGLPTVLVGLQNDECHNRCE